MTIFENKTYQWQPLEMDSGLPNQLGYTWVVIYFFVQLDKTIKIWVVNEEVCAKVKVFFSNNW